MGGHGGQGGSYGPKCEDEARACTARRAPGPLRTVPSSCNPPGEGPVTKEPRCPCSLLLSEESLRTLYCS